MNEKHTPGPWEIQAGDDYYVHAPGYPAAKRHSFPDPADGAVAAVGNATPDCGWANAHLIAAAPDMLEALTDIRATLLKQADSSYVPTLGDLAGMLDKADAALAKANGELAPTTERG